MAIYQVINMVAMRHRFVAAVGTVSVKLLMRFGLYGLYGLGIDRSVKPKRIAGSLCLVRQLMTRCPFPRS